LMSSCCISSPKVTVVDFYATWCGPCKAVAPQYEDMSRSYDEKQCVFCKVDVDRCRDIAQRFNVTAMPTFAVFRERALVESIRGADMGRLRALVDSQVRLVQAAAAPAAAAKKPKVAKKAAKKVAKKVAKKTAKKAAPKKAKAAKKATKKAAKKTVAKK